MGFLHVIHAAQAKANYKAAHEPVCTLYFSEAAALENGTFIYDVLNERGQAQKIEATANVGDKECYGWEDKVQVWEGPRSSIVATANGRRCSQEEFAHREMVRKTMDSISNTSPRF